MSTFDLNSIDEVITPCCDVEVKTSDIGDKLKCPACGMNLKQRIFLPFLEYLFFKLLVVGPAPRFTQEAMKL